MPASPYDPYATPPMAPQPKGQIKGGIFAGLGRDNQAAFKAAQEGNPTPVSDPNAPGLGPRGYGGSGEEFDITPADAELGGNPYIPAEGAGARAVNNGLQSQAYNASQRAAPTINMGPTNMFTTGAGASIGEADSSNLRAAQGGLGLGASATGDGYQGQINTANGLILNAGGPAYQNQLNASNGLAMSAGGPAYQNQLNASNGLIWTAGGPAYQGQLGAAATLQNAATGDAYQNQVNAARALGSAAQGPGIVGQYGLANQLVAAGQTPAGPSVAEQQLRMGADASLQQQLAMAAGARGGNAALALQNAGQGQGAVMGNLNSQQALLRAQEDMANRQFTAGTLQNAAGIYGNAAGLQGNLLQGSAGAYGQAASTQGNLLGAASNAYGQAAGTQIGALGTSAQAAQGAQAGQVSALTGMAGAAQGAQQTQAGALGTAGNLYGGAAATQQAGLTGQANVFQGIASNQLGQAQTQAGIAQNYGQLAYQQGTLQGQQNQLNDQTMLGSQSLGLQTLTSDRDAHLQAIQAAEGFGQQQYAIDTGYNQALAAQQNNWQHQVVGAAIQGGAALAGSAMMMSDVRAKTQIAPAEGDVADAFRPLSSSSYFYKDPNAPGAEQGQQFGPMAQQLERTPAGRTAVTQMPNGQKGIDTGRLALLNASATADMRRELDAIKARSESDASSIRGMYIPKPLARLDDENSTDADTLGKIDAAQRAAVLAMRQPTTYPTPNGYGPY